MNSTFAIVPMLIMSGVAISSLISMCYDFALALIKIGPESPLGRDVAISGIPTFVLCALFIWLAIEGFIVIRRRS